VPMPYVLNAFLWRSYKNTRPVFHLATPVLDTDTYIFKVHVFTKQAQSE